LPQNVFKKEENRKKTVQNEPKLRSVAKIARLQENAKALSRTPAEAGIRRNKLLIFKKIN